MLEQNQKKRKKIIEFVEKHFDDAKAHDRGKGFEYRFLCPFCNGGNTQERSFDLNPVTGACRCWRASCNWRSSVEWFVKHYLDVPYQRAVEIIGGEEAETPEELQKDLRVLGEQMERYHKRSDINSERDSIDVWVRGSKPLTDEHRLFSRISAWIKDERGYNVEKFLEQHNLYVPPQIGRFDGRVLFEVRSDGDRAYLAYAFNQNLERKTLNPSGKVLSQMLYNYDKVKRNRVIIVCEGIFDSARLYSYGFGATSLFGVNASPRQLRMLSDTNAEEICVALDHGTLKRAKELAMEIGEYIPDKRVSILRIDEKQWISSLKFEKGTDPDDLSEKQFMEYWKHRLRKASGEKDRLRIKLKKLARRSNN